MKSTAHVFMGPAVRRSLRKLGADIRIARKKRRLRIRDLAAAASCSADTVRRLESGEPGVSIGVLAMVLQGLDRRMLIDHLLDVTSDVGGLLLEEARLPRRVHRRSAEKARNDESSRGH
jgi:transcriptional regulator with XRE-family HTH domain